MYAFLCTNITKPKRTSGCNLEKRTEDSRNIEIEQKRHVVFFQNSSNMISIHLTTYSNRQKKLQHGKVMACFSHGLSHMSVANRLCHFLIKAAGPKIPAKPDFVKGGC